MTKPATDLISAPVWDAFVRCFHWSLVTLFAISVASGKVGGEWIVWHMRSGYAILALVVFRLIWGFVGGEYARYTSFLSGPAHSFKFAATMQSAQAGSNPILIRIETKAGHGAGKPTAKIIEERADKWGFLVKVLN